MPLPSLFNLVSVLVPLPLWFSLAVCTSQSPMKPSARLCFAVAKPPSGAGPAASPWGLTHRASGVFMPLFCSPRGPHFLLLPFCVGAAERSFWSALPRQPSLQPAEGCRLSALLNVIIYFIRSKSTPLLFWQLLPWASAIDSNQ